MTFDTALEATLLDLHFIYIYVLSVALTHAMRKSNDRCTCVCVHDAASDQKLTKIAKTFFSAEAKNNDKGIVHKFIYPLFHFFPGCKVVLKVVSHWF